MSDQPCPLCGCPTPGGHACSTVPPLPPVPLVVDLGGRRAVIVGRSNDPQAYEVASMEDLGSVVRVNLRPTYTLDEIKAAAARGEPLRVRRQG